MEYSYPDTLIGQVEKPFSFENLLAVSGCTRSHLKSYLSFLEVTLLAEAVLIVKIFSVVEFHSPSVVTPNTASIQGIGSDGIDSTRGCGTGARIVLPSWSNGIGNSDGRHTKGWGGGKQATWHVSSDATDAARNAVESIACPIGFGVLYCKAICCVRETQISSCAQTAVLAEG
jgi:hypothetical protein